MLAFIASKVGYPSWNLALSLPCTSYIESCLGCCFWFERDVVGLYGLRLGAGGGERGEEEKRSYDQEERREGRRS